VLDSSRLKQALALRLGVAPGAIDAAVLGEHGDSEVAVFSTIRVGGVALDEFGGAAPSDRPGIGESVRDAGYSIVTGKGYTAYGVATAIVRICEAIVRDEKVVLPVSTFVDGQLGLANICLSLPCLLGAGGIERVLTPQLSPVERVGMQASATALRAALAGLPA
jgi:L-lactate dehydrogenase